MEPSLGRTGRQIGGRGRAGLSDGSLANYKNTSKNNDSNISSNVHDSNNNNDNNVQYMVYTTRYAIYTAECLGFRVKKYRHLLFGSSQAGILCIPNSDSN